MSAKKNTTKKHEVGDATESGKEKRLCFTIMPFGGWFDTYYDGIYKPAIVAAGLEPRRADDLFRPSKVVDDIWDLTKRADVILADLTGKKPNVFYELGLAHAIGKPAILVVDDLNDVPFDLRALRVIDYDKNQQNWGDALQRKIELAIGELLESPIESVLPAFLDVDQSARPSVSTTEKELVRLRQDVDALKRKQRTALNTIDHLVIPLEPKVDEEFLEDAEKFASTLRSEGRSWREVRSFLRETAGLSLDETRRVMLNVTAQFSDES